MKLFWRLFQNPIYDSTSPLYLELNRFEVSEAQFSTFAQGGFGSGGFTIQNASQGMIRDAADNWLMKRITATDAEGNIAYEGFVAEVRITDGFHNYARSIDGFANRGQVEYNYAGSYVGYGKCPKGSVCYGRLEIDESDVADTTTQTSWGIKEAWIDITDIGTTTPTIANGIGEAALKRALNSRGLDTNLTNGLPEGTSEIQLTLWGYYSTLQFEKTTGAYKKLTEMRTIVYNALTAGSHAPFIATDYTYMDTIGKTITYNTSNNIMWVQDHITGALETGDSNGRDVFFQIWENRLPYLAVRSTSPKYFTRGGDSRIRDSSHTVIPPYMVRAGGHLALENRDESIGSFSDVWDRKYMSLIEETNYDDVNGVLHIPPSASTEMTTERLLARARRRISRGMV